MTRKRYLILFLFFLLLVSAGFIFNQIQKPFFDVSVKQRTSFEWSNDNQESPSLSYFLSIPSTPYFLCRYQLSQGVHAGINISRVYLLVIDAKKKEQVMRLQWDEASEEGKPYFLAERKAFLTSIALKNTQPEFVLETIESRSNNEPKFGAVTGLIRALGIAPSNQWQRKRFLIQFSGAFRTLPAAAQSPWFAPPIQRSIDNLSPSFVEPMHITYTSGSKDLLVTDNQSHKRWRFKRSDLTDLLPDARRVSKDLRQQGLTSYEQAPYRISWHSTDHDLYCFPDIAGFPVFEFRPENLHVEEQEGVEASDISDVFRLVGHPFSMRPIAAMHNNRVIVAAYRMQSQHKPLPGTELLQYYTRPPDEGNRQSFFEETPSALNFTQRPELICQSPIDDEHLLVYRDRAFWAVRWDGSEEYKLFPIK